MLFFKKKFAIIILFAAIFMLSGIYITDYNMKSITMSAGEKPIELHFEQEILTVRFLGIEKNINTDSFKPQTVLDNIGYMFSKMLGLMEIK